MKSNTQRELVIKLMDDLISKNEFVQAFFENASVHSDYLLELLEEVYMEKNADDLEDIMYVGFVLNLFTIKYTSILCKLIEEDWHISHEDIAALFQKLKPIDACESLYISANHRLEYLEYDEAYALAVKCIWALGTINTDLSIEKLKLLATSSNEIIRESAINQLSQTGNL